MCRVVCRVLTGYTHRYIHCFCQMGLPHFLAAPKDSVASSVMTMIPEKSGSRGNPGSGACQVTNGHHLWICTRLPQVRDVCLALRCSLAVKHWSFQWDVDYPLTIRQWKMLILQFADPVQCVTSWSRFYNRTIARNQEILIVTIELLCFSPCMCFARTCSGETAAVNVSKTGTKISNGYFPVIRDNTRPWKCLTWSCGMKQAACSAWVPPTAANCILLALNNTSIPDGNMPKHSN